MNRITRIAAIALSFAAAGSAFADDITIDPVQHQSLKTRAQVQAELAQYQAAKINPWSSSYQLSTGFKPQVSRAEVRADVQAALASGELQAMTGEDSGAAYLARAHAKPAAGSSTVVAGR